ncbi:bifunctional folylpolyglutamate synthase/dihydrofolate synthase [candidate division KSB1 bacterium]|nr:bifunctional folylpolyglutamate synthase/dihydrofolate synthase [candidate division KSB1 bacterium]
MTYQQTLEFLYSRHAKDMKLGLEHIRELLKWLDHPEQKFKSVHIAGTNGKGSTAAILESMLREAGYRTGLYTSPHLIDLRERIKVNGVCIPEEEVMDYVGRIMPHVEDTQASFFEILTAIAFLYFSHQQVDIAVIETGLGGRLDATNTLTPEVSVITEIGLDHTHILGKNMEIIVAEKAGILKENVPGVIGSRNESVKQLFKNIGVVKSIALKFVDDDAKIERIKCSEQCSRFNWKSKNTKYTNLSLNLLGEHQVENAATAVSVVETLNEKGWNIAESAIRQGLQKTVWRARLELVQIAPKVLLDSAHNPMGVNRLVHALNRIFRYERLILIFGVLADKDYKKMCADLIPLADQIVLTKPNNDRALDPKLLAKLAVFKDKDTTVKENPKEAWLKAMELADPHDLICVAGSIYFVGDILHLLGQDNCSPTG